MLILQELEDNKSSLYPQLQTLRQGAIFIERGEILHNGVQCNDGWSDSRCSATKEDMQISEKYQPRRSHYFTDRKKFFAKVDPHHKQWAPGVITQT